MSCRLSFAVQAGSGGTAQALNPARRLPPRGSDTVLPIHEEDTLAVATRWPLPRKRAMDRSKTLSIPPVRQFASTQQDDYKCLFMRLPENCSGAVAIDSAARSAIFPRCIGNYAFHYSAWTLACLLYINMYRRSPLLLQQYCPVLLLLFTSTTV